MNNDSWLVHEFIVQNITVITEPLLYVLQKLDKLNRKMLRE
jgi:hypothetical protein